ncbi:rust resistance kinase Lr10-like isoform X2 [Alnus glutinosa]|uniref:rust resistance kinase Lr10-like isoform X2 n=1 Tax=Alnus glutinosa TaxID=3517 RepID=UPI002D78D91D|nr:rust resistance kinase Lr10-like isoform X2 [Alnus glutinosa]
MAGRMAFSSRLTTLVVVVLVHQTCSAEDGHQCAPSSCGDIHNISNPFRLQDDPENCGNRNYTLSCENNNTVLYLDAGKYYVRQINYDNYTIRVVDSGIDQVFIPRYFLNLSDFNFRYSQAGRYGELISRSVVFVMCEIPVNSALYLETSTCFRINGSDSEYSSNSSKTHRYVKVGKTNPLDVKDTCQIEGMSLTSWPGNDDRHVSCSDVHNALAYGFELSWHPVMCERICGSRQYCYLDEANHVHCYLQYSLGFLDWAFGVFYLSLLYVIEIKKMTKSFKDKVGEGGYGTVYKGTLRSGRFVAIKMLGKSKANGQDFINEVATIGRIHHVNVVQLIGFCVQGSSRALVYEFMPKGSLNQYIFSPEESDVLSYKKIYGIAIGIARGIEYLHRGCEMQILHFDIKPHNILLDENFTPKISDFGLAKLYPVDNSIVSLTAARGTLGYMAPELFYKNIGGVSYKSDVYSFGMLLMEMTSKRKNVSAFVEHSSQIYFPTWVYDQLQDGNDIKMEDATKEEKKMIKKMIIVALWCIQMKPSDRPSMSNVLEMLEGEVECLQMPPMPTMSSPERPMMNAGENSNQSCSSIQLDESNQSTQF